MRVWVAGCSTGEEAYSLAILVHRGDCEAAGKSAPVQVFASDLDRRRWQSRAPASTRRASPPTSLPQRLARFFTRHDHGYEVNKPVRDSIVFTSHNLVSDPPFSRMDLVSCRNVLIYLGPEPPAAARSRSWASR